MRGWRRRWFRRGISKKIHPIVLSAILGIALAVGVIVTLEVRLHPILEAVARAEISNLVSDQINREISQYLVTEELTYGDFISMEKGSDGQITALTSNMTTLNRLRSDILDMALASAQGLEQVPLSIPMGNLFGLNFLSGKGIILTVDVVTAGRGEAVFSHIFEDTGINQTRHQILLTVTVEVTTLLPGGDLHQTVTAQIPVAETVIVGEVPQTLLQLP